MELDLGELDNIEIEGTQESTKKGVVDIIFLMDTSGSMGPAIVEIGKNIGTFVQNLDPTIVKDWRARVFSFSDMETDIAELKFNVSRDWTQDPQEIVNQMVECIELVKKQGGGDEPESSLDAMFLSARDGFEESYNERTRVIILFTDATPKKILKETLGVDADGIALLSQQIADGHTYVHMFAPVHDDYTAIKNNSGRFVNYIPLNEDGSSPVEALKNTDFTKALETLGKSVSQASLIA
ncbi:MAG: vWA domain-containing protein [Campylobacterota bacterium]|nr:vWA domain-containing protein [Campylobacterota bacterium]